MPLIGVPVRITAELLYALARMGHGDSIVIADANFPSDSVATCCSLEKRPIRVSGSTAQITADILKLMPLDAYVPHPVNVMDRVDSDKERNLEVPAYKDIALASGLRSDQLAYVERFRLVLK
jgi:L-fucose mutarotase